MLRLLVISFGATSPIASVELARSGPVGCVWESRSGHYGNSSNGSQTADRKSGGGSPGIA